MTISSFVPPRNKSWRRHCMYRNVSGILYCECLSPYASVMKRVHDLQAELDKLLPRLRSKHLVSCRTQRITASKVSIAIHRGHYYCLFFSVVCWSDRFSVEINHKTLEQPLASCLKCEEYIGVSFFNPLRSHSLQTYLSSGVTSGAGEGNGRGAPPPVTPYRGRHRNESRNIFCGCR